MDYFFCATQKSSRHNQESLVSTFKPLVHLVWMCLLYFLWVFTTSCNFRYFTLFMNLLNDCSEECGDDKVADGSRKRTSSNLSALRNCTVLAMSNLLNANIDSGLMHSIGRSTSLRLKCSESAGYNRETWNIFLFCRSVCICCVNTNILW